MKFSIAWCLLLCAIGSAASMRLALARNGTAATANITKAKQSPTFQAYYGAHVGRGIWKWSVALDMYQQHLAQFALRPATMLEIGVQSGGSIDMYKAVLPQCHYYGMDINTNCMAFQNPTTTIFIGDQASVPVWNHFFTAVAANLDICIDDGGHQSHQMLATIQQVLPHMNPGGFFLTEDIHGVNEDYLTNFFNGAAYAIGSLASTTGAKVASVHMYPFILGVQMEGGTPPVLPAPTVTVASLAELTAALPNHPGGVVELKNPTWPSFLLPAGLQNVFGTFYDICGGVVREEPAHCHNGMSSTCTMIATNTHLQNLVKGVHILPFSTLVEVHAAPPIINAVRKGSEWIPYSGPA